MLVCPSADLPNSLLLAPTSSSLSLVFKTNPRLASNPSFRSVSQSVNQPPFSESRSSGHPLTVSSQAIKTSRAGRTAISARPGPKPSPPSSFHLRTWPLLCFCAGLFPLAHSALLFGFLWPSERSLSQYRRNFETARRHQRAIHLFSEIPLIHARAEWEPEARPRPSIPLVPPSLHCLFSRPPNRLRRIRLLKAIQPQRRHPHPSQLYGISSKESWPAHSAHPANPALPANSSGT